VLAPSLQHQAVFWLQGSFNEPHVILLGQRPQSKHGAHDRSRFHTDEHGGVETAGNRNAIFRDHIQFHRMLIEPFAS
jgi:hypothetical protein